MPNQMKTITQKVNKTREAIIQSFLACLKEDEIPWERGWESIAKPFNAVTKSGYNGVNAFWLSYLQRERGYSDPRWCTFRQAEAQGWKIKRGSKGTKVEFWSLWDKEERERVSAEEAHRRAEDLSQKEYYERFQPVSRDYTVFNAEQIEGIEPYVTKKNIIHEEQLTSVRNTLISNMAIKYEEKGEQAYYSPGEDKIVLPEMKRFKDDYAYMSTLLHESAHATGAEHRMNRLMNDAFGTPGYAREELRAEIASAFTAQTTGIPYQQNEFMENHKAYIQNWISTLENYPNELFAAIKDAEKISDYLIEKGEFLKEREAVFEVGDSYAYVHVQEVEEGIKYSIYNQNFVPMDEGTIENSSLSFEDAALKAVGVEELGSDSFTKVDTQSFLEEIEEQNYIAKYRERLNYVRDNEIEAITLDFVRSRLEELGYDDIDVTAAKLYGSRAKGTYSENSDIDVLIQYEGDIAEDIMFNLLNKDGLQIAYTDVDINPITPDKSGTIEEFLQRIEAEEPAIKEQSYKEEYQRFAREHKQNIENMQTDKEVIVINAFAGPGAGKTVSCMDICSELKKRGYNAEYVQEYAKELVYDKNFEMLDGSEENQFEILKKQIHRMDRLYEECDFIVTDSPIFLNEIYNNNPTPEYSKMIDEIYSHYNNFAYFVQRDVSHFQEEGRIHNLQESMQKDNEIKAMLEEHDVYYGTYPHNRIMKVVDNSIVTFNRMNAHIFAADILEKQGIVLSDFKYDENNYLEFKADVQNQQYQGLFRLHDPKFGEDMKLVMFVHQEQEPLLQHNWKEIETYLKKVSEEKYEKIMDSKTADNEAKKDMKKISKTEARGLIEEEYSVYKADGTGFSEVSNLDNMKEGTDLYASRKDVEDFNEYQEMIDYVRNMENELDTPEDLRVIAEDGRCISRELLQDKYNQLKQEEQSGFNEVSNPANQIQQYVNKNSKAVRVQKPPVMEI